jgi:hypothetical protein
MASAPSRPTQKISSVQAFFMLATAFIVDATQFLVLFLPGVGEVIEFFLGATSVILFGVWFALNGVSYFGGKKAGTKTMSALAGAVVELVPILDALPGTTLAIAGIIYSTRAEDAQKMKEFDAANDNAPVPTRRAA